MGSSSHLPPSSSQPDPYPPPSQAQQARCLTPTERLPAGGCGAGGDKGGEELWELGSSTARPFDPVPDRQHRVCSLPPAPPPLSLSFISHTDPRG
ncbi:hypothetical protein NQZ68_016691 [Dissostichus eleginoides]|nr:hypothetical protein NQZ68_016691 [Dissostichus eleginoides]